MNSGPCPAESNCTRELPGSQAAATNVTKRPEVISSASAAFICFIAASSSSCTVKLALAYARQTAASSADPIPCPVTSPQRHDDSPAREKLPVKVIPARLVRRLVPSRDFETFNLRDSAGQQRLLDRSRHFHVVFQALELTLHFRLAQRCIDVLADFSRQRP